MAFVQGIFISCRYIVFLFTVPFFRTQHTLFFYSIQVLAGYELLASSCHLKMGDYKKKEIEKTISFFY
ncbi:MAG: hypothetical protein CSA81_08610 [Acidobacteria bacterium]|nr:MAG: hypothetical protein CSA81_08610 [Acidobacteriota bacterium]